MCGIYITNIPFSEEEVKQKLELIKYRGPDHTGIDKIDDLTFGHLRLSILDIDVRSHQPMQFEEFTIVFNDEPFIFLISFSIFMYMLTSHNYFDNYIILFVSLWLYIQIGRKEITVDKKTIKLI